MRQADKILMLLVYMHKNTPSSFIINIPKLEITWNVRQWYVGK